MYLGIDIGTSSVKTVLFDRDQRLIAQASQPLTVQRPHPGWSEQDPEAWWQRGRKHHRSHRRCITASPTCAASASPARCTAPSASTTTTACSARRSSGTTAAPWPNAPSSKPPSPARAASPATSPCRASPPRSSLWLRKHEPRLFARIDTVLLPKDYIRFRLTGHHVSEMSDASGTLWLDVAARDWSDDLLEATGLTRAHMPRLVEGSAPSGDLLPALAAPLGRHRPGRRRRRRRRQRRGRLRRRRRHPRHRLRLDRHLGRALRLQRPLLARTRPERSTPSATRSPTLGTRWA